MEKYEKREGGREGGERRREKKVSTYLDDGTIISGVEVGRGGQKATHALFHQKNPESVVLRRGLPGWLRKGKGGRDGGMSVGAHAKQQLFQTHPS